MSEECGGHCFWRRASTQKQTLCVLQKTKQKTHPAPVGAVGAEQRDGQEDEHHDGRVAPQHGLAAAHVARDLDRDHVGGEQQRADCGDAHADRHVLDAAAVCGGRRQVLADDDHDGAAERDEQRRQQLGRRRLLEHDAVGDRRDEGLCFLMLFCF